MEKMSIEQVKLLTVAAAKTSTRIASIMADGHVGVGDLDDLPGLLAAVRGFGQVDYKKVLPQLSDMDDQEKEEVSQVFKANFELEGDTVEAVVEEGFNILLASVQAVMTFVDLGKRAKA